MSSRIWRLFCIVVIVSMALSTLSAQVSEVPSDATPLPGSEGVWRLGKKIFFPNVSQSDFPLRTPRFAAPIRSAVWSKGETSLPLDVNPDIEFWQFSTKSKIEGAGVVTIEFDAPALLLNELKPITSLGDGSFWLAGHLATTFGEKLRYEPQPHKNTVGYWTISKDKAVWSFVLDKPGKFNVAILQGCGSGQGGSIATLSINRFEVKENQEPFTQDFEVLETGHFQNFQWKQLQPIELKEAGTYSLQVTPKKIRKAALMDIRAIQLIRLPN